MSDQERSASAPPSSARAQRFGGTHQEAASKPAPQQAGGEPFTYHHAEYDGGVHWFSTEHDGEEIAHAHVLEKQGPGGRHVEIRKLWTNPYYRRKGIGSQLVEEVANHVPDLELRLRPYPVDGDGTQTTEDIEQFYAGRGFDRYQRKDGDPFELGDFMARPASAAAAAIQADAAAARQPGPPTDDSLATARGSNAPVVRAGGDDIARIPASRAPGSSRNRPGDPRPTAGDSRRPPKGGTMATPARPVAAGDLEPGWSRDEPNPYGPCYQRHAPRKGIIRVVSQSGQNYAWYLTTTARPEGLSWPREGFPHPRDAMRDADEQVARTPLRMFELLTPGEAQELYRKLARAYDWGRQGPGETALDEVTGELFRHMKILQTDPSYHGPEPHKFIHAVREASYGAALQAMSASPNKASWLAMTPAAAAARGAAAAPGVHGSPDFPRALPVRPAGIPARRSNASGNTPRTAAARPGRPR